MTLPAANSASVVSFDVTTGDEWIDVTNLSEPIVITLDVTAGLANEASDESAPHYGLHVSGMCDLSDPHIPDMLPAGATNITFAVACGGTDAAAPLVNATCPSLLAECVELPSFSQVHSQL